MELLTVIRGGPAHKGKIGEALENPPREPIPDEGTSGNNQEVFVSPDLPAVSFEGV
jgi:hypothetical protein